MDDVKTPQPMFPVDLENAPKIMLAGREWAIPKLAPKQSRHVVPAMMKIVPLVGRVQASVTILPDGKTQVDEASMMKAMALIDEEAFEAVADCIYWSLKRGYQISQAEFDEMPIDLPEMLNALPVIMRQIGFIKMKPAGEVSPGEASAVAQ